MNYTTNGLIHSSNKTLIISKRKTIEQPLIKPPSSLNENINNKQVTTVITKDDISYKKMKWGEPTWIFLHTICQKIKKEHFSLVRIELLQIIYNVCSILPCPDCAMHAVSYLDKVNFNALQTKEQLINFMFLFHNNVNQRKNVKLFLYENLIEKYSKAITINVINNFLNIIQDKSGSNKMIANELFRKRIILLIKEWLYKNISYFEM